MVKMRATTNEHGHLRTTEEIDTVAKGGDPAITTTTAPIAKLPQGTKTIITKGMIAEARDTVATEKKTTGAATNFRQKNPESTTHHQRIC
jgi:hypothetical protein